eukprot:1527716-Rhodomonas_salina.1
MGEYSHKLVGPTKGCAVGLELRPRPNLAQPRPSRCRRRQPDSFRIPFLSPSQELPSREPANSAMMREFTET